MDKPQQPSTAQAPEITPERWTEFHSHLLFQQNLPMGIIAGLASAALGAAIWAGVAVATNMKIGWIAMGIGVLVGFAVRFLGKGVTNTFGAIGAACSLLGCLVGNFLSVCWFISSSTGTSYATVIGTLASKPEDAFRVMQATFTPMDILFYGIALYEGYKFSFRQVTEKDAAEFFGP